MFDFVIKYTIIFCTGGDMKNIATKTNKLLLRCSRIILAALSVFLLTSLFVAQDSCAAELFSELITKGAEIFTGMRDIIYVVAGFGIIGVAVGGFFGNLNWKWLGAIIIGLMIIAMTAAFVQYVTGEELEGVTDTLK